MKRTALRLDVQSGLKICEVCGALNHHRNPLCSNCSWAGVFDVDDAHISALLHEIGRDIVVVRSPNRPTVALLWKAVRRTVRRGRNVFLKSIQRWL